MSSQKNYAFLHMNGICFKILVTPLFPWPALFGWCSWLSRQSNTLKVPSSILGSNMYFLFSFFVNISVQRKCARVFVCFRM
jgi:hypothetical protein